MAVWAGHALAALKGRFAVVLAASAPRQTATYASVALVSGMICAALAGCGSASKPLARPCTQKGRAAVARAVGVAAKGVAVAASVGNNGSPQCSYRAGRAVALVNVDSGPQPYFILERTAVEASQQFSSAHNALEVDHVPGVGLDAFWIPAERQFLTSDGVNLLTVTVTWPGAARKKLLGLGQAAAQAHLGKLVQPPGFSG